MEKGEAMADHVHEWELGSNGLIVCWAGEKKVHVMEWDKVIRRLNATERFSAEDAREISSEVHSAWWPLQGESPYEDGLRAYTAALEGK